jgi:hypothetical protein
MLSRLNVTVISVHVSVVEIGWRQISGGGGIGMEILVCAPLHRAPPDGRVNIISYSQEHDQRYTVMRGFVKGSRKLILARATAMSAHHP